MEQTNFFAYVWFFDPGCSTFATFVIYAENVSELITIW